MFPEREAKTAAAWWADQLLAVQPPLAEQMGAEKDNPMRGSTASALSLVAQANRRVDDPTKVDVFRECLTSGIRMALSRCTFLPLRIDVDYDPDLILCNAAEVAGIDVGMTTFPWKTTMWIDENGVRVAKGYDAEPVALPLLD